MEPNRKIKKINKINIAIAVLLALAALLLFDHFRVHGYFFDAHDLLLQTESGLGFDSHEFFSMLFFAIAIALAVFKIISSRFRSQ